MFFDTDTAKQFPRCNNHVKEFLNAKTLKSKQPRVYDAYITACGTARSQGINILKWGNVPEIVIVGGYDLMVVKKQLVCGETPVERYQRNTGIVKVAGIRAGAFEKCESSTDLVNNKRRFESTVLHELVHYARQTGGETERVYVSDDSKGALEAGEYFEELAYGKLTCDMDEINDAKSSYL